MEKCERGVERFSHPAALHPSLFFFLICRRSTPPFLPLSSPSEDALDCYCDLLNRLAHPGTPDGGPLTLPALVDAANEGNVANMYVMLLRLLVAAEVRAHWEEKYAPFALGLHDDVMDAPVPLDAYVRRHVEPLGEDADHVCAVAAASVLGVPITVVYLDRSGAEGVGGGGGGGTASQGEEAANSFAFDPEEAAPGTSALPPRVTLLSRPGHYDILDPAGDAVLKEG